MRAWLRGVLLRLVPTRWRRSSRLERQLYERLDRRVLRGPFEGLRYVDRSYSSAYWPKLLGTYELELQGILEPILAEKIEQVLVLGAAEGYYAVGLAARLPGAHVFGWEADSAARAAARELAILNGVDGRVEFRGICDAAELENCGAQGRRTLVVADIDGGEAILLDPGIVPRLHRATMVVEVHDCFVPGVAQLLRRRFESTHDIQFVPSRPRSGMDLPDLGFPHKFDGALLQLLSENRPPGNDWLVMTPRGSG